LRKAQTPGAIAPTPWGYTVHSPEGEPLPFHGNSSIRARFFLRRKNIFFMKNETSLMKNKTSFMRKSFADMPAKLYIG
jgi:hypothetical protein